MRQWNIELISLFSSAERIPFYSQTGIIFPLKHELLPVSIKYLNFASKQMLAISLICYPRNMSQLPACLLKQKRQILINLKSSSVTLAKSLGSVEARAATEVPNEIMRTLTGSVFAFLAVFVVPQIIAQNAVIHLKPSVSKTTFKLPPLPRRDAQVSATYTIVAPEGRRVLLRCENGEEVVECTHGTLQVINGLPKGHLCEKDLSTHQTQVILSFINYQQVSDKTTCKAFSIPGLPTPDDDDEKGEPSTKANDGFRSTTCECGWANQRRIVGGTTTKMNEFPFMAGIVHKSTRQRFCGGAIISENLILTAAHCLDNMQPKDLEVVVGDHDMKGRIRTSSEQRIGVSRFLQHERWDQKRIINDIGIIRVSDTIKFNRDVGPTCLPSSRSSLTGQTITAMGWGLTQTLFERDRGLLRKVDLSVVDMPSCSASYGNTLNTRQPTQLCTYSRNKDTCQGDSGGPLVWLDPETNRYTQVALVSYGKKCGSTSPAVNTDVSAYMDWIQNGMRRLSPGNSACIKM